MTGSTGDDVATTGPAVRHRPDKKASRKASRRSATRRAGCHDVIAGRTRHYRPPTEETGKAIVGVHFS